MPDIADTKPGDFFRFSGTTHRLEFLLKALLQYVLFAVAAAAYYPLLATTIGPSLPVDVQMPVLVGGWLLMGLAFIGYHLPLIIRRLKDTGVSGWWYVPITITSGIFGLLGPLIWIAAIINILFLLYLVFWPPAGEPETRDSENPLPDTTSA